MGSVGVKSRENDLETLIFLKKWKNKEKNVIARNWTRDLWHKSVVLYQLSYLGRYYNPDKTLSIYRKNANKSRGS